MSIRKRAICPRFIDVFTGESSPELHHPCYEHLHSRENTMTKKKASSSLPYKLTHCLGLPFILPQIKDLASNLAAWGVAQWRVWNTTWELCGHRHPACPCRCSPQRNKIPRWCLGILWFTNHDFCPSSLHPSCIL